MAAHTFKGKNAARRAKTKRFSQDSTRRPILMRDQHGRPWSASTENRSGMPTGMIANDFSAPWLPDQKYLVVNAQNPTEIYIDYTLMFNDRRRTNEEYHRRAVRMATKKNWPTPEKGAYSDDLIEAAGQPPRPVELVIAAYQGNRWILGLCDDCKRSNRECRCAGGYLPAQADPRLAKLIVRRIEDIPAEEGMDFSDKSRRRTISDLERTAPARPAAFVDDDDIGLGNQSDFASEADLGGPTMPGDTGRGHDANAGAESVVEEYDDDFADDIPADSAEDDESPAARSRDEARLAIEALHSDPGFEAGAQDLEAKADEALAREEAEDAADKAQMGGRRVAPAAADRAERQAPRRPGASPVRDQRGGERQAKGTKATGRSSSAAERKKRGDNRPSLADGAKPVVGSGASQVHVSDHDRGRGATAEQAEAAKRRAGVTED